MVNFKKVDDMCIHLDTIPQRDIRTDRQTDRRTELLNQYRALHAMHAMTRVEI